MLKTEGEKFLLDGKEVHIYSGSIHYFRIVPELWADRLLKLKACGFNTVETYVCWNLHEREKGVFDFSGALDLVEFLRTAQRVGLMAIVRPGPYICAEWDGGGFPYWLIAKKKALRCMEEEYLKDVEEYFNVLLPLLKPCLYSNGGNVIAMQIENEYGSYSNDKEYLRFLKNLYEKNGSDCLYFTSDGASKLMLSGGTLPEVFKTVNFGSKVKNAFQELESFQKNLPKMSAEFWCGWFDWWGDEHHVRSWESIENEVRDFFEENANFNFYMFCGGTNFGFTAGANMNGKYTATVTSYDYFAPLTEYGDYTPTYFALRDLLHEKTGKPLLPLPPAPKCQNIGEVYLDEFASLLENLNNIGQKHRSVVPHTMEDYGQGYGYIYYETEIEGGNGKHELSLRNLHDVGYLFEDGEKKAAFCRMDYGVFRELYQQDQLVISDFCGKKKLGVLVEALGRVNYGEFLLDRKGITDIFYGCYRLTSFTVYTLPFDNLQKVCYTDKPKPCPAFLKGRFQAEPGKECFVDFEGFTKGCIFINGFNLGRYWKVGPQKTLYVPSPLLKEENEIVVFELEGYEKPVIKITDKPKLG